MPALASTIAAAMRHHQHALAVAHHFGRFAQDQLDQPGVLVHLGGECLRARRRHHRPQIDLAAFRLGHDLLRDHHNVAALQRQPGGGKPLRDQVGDVVVRPHQRDAGERRDAQLGGGSGRDTFGRARHDRPPPAGR